MKNKFKGYYQLSPSDFDKLWENAIFIFDTNVLLNLYRYKESTRKELLSVIKELNNRVWIPYHVGLEFQRNRLKVIEEQHKKYADVTKSITTNVSKIETDLEALKLKNRHSHINPEKFINDINIAKDAFINQLNNLKEQSINVSSDDEIRNKIDELFDNKIGDPPENQNKIDELFKEAENRYKNSIPPGFKDAEKDKGELDEFTYGGLLYKRKYGDFLIWKQIIEYAKDKSLTDIIFITDDIKSDWWLQGENDGNKTLGARPELVDEITREANIERFYMYSTERFLRYANKQLEANVTDDAIEEIRDINSKSISDTVGFFTKKAELDPVFSWLHDKFTTLFFPNEDISFCIASHNNEKVGFSVMNKFDTGSLKARIFEAKDFIATKQCSSVIIIAIIPSHDDVALKIFDNFMIREYSNGLGYLAGELLSKYENSSLITFEPYYYSKSAMSIFLS